MNGEKLSYCVDFDSQADELRELLAVADIVIEGSRPAALRAGAGSGRVTLRRERAGSGCRSPGMTSIPGGRHSVTTPRSPAAWSGPASTDRCSARDAIADPLTGLEATWAVTESLVRGGGESIHVSHGRGRRDLRGAADRGVGLGVPGLTAAGAAGGRARRPSSAPITRRYGTWSSERRCLSC